MAQKTKYLRKMDVPTQVKGGGTFITESVDINPPAIAGIDAPQNLTVSGTLLARSASTPFAYINIYWSAPDGEMPERYIIEYAKNSSFTSPERVTTFGTSASLVADASTLANTYTYYIRVASISANYVSEWSNVVSTATPTDTTPAAEVSGVTTNWTTGDLLIAWTNPTSDNFKDARVRIWNMGRTVLYKTVYSVAGRYVWTEEENYRDTSGVPLMSGSIDIYTRTWLNTLSTGVTTTATFTAPTPVTSVVTDFTTGDLNVRWTNPTTRRYKSIELRLYESAAKVTTYLTRNLVGETFTWTADDNIRALTPATPDPSIYYELQVRSWLGTSSTIVSGLVTKALPATPGTITQSWSGATGLEGPDLVITWSGISNIRDYAVTLDGTTYYTTDTKLVYAFAQNAQQHAGTADHTITYSIVARDRLLQSSASPATGTAINAAPPNPTVSATGYFSVIAASATPTNVQDIDHYVFRLYLTTGSVLQQTITTFSPEMVFQLVTSNTYYVTCQLFDMFGRSSSEVASGNVTVEAITLAELRSNALYTDSDGNTSTTLAVLKDGILTAPGVAYASPSATWRWIKVERATKDRYGNITVASSAAGSTAFYVGFSEDDVTYSYYYGTIVDGYTLPSITSVEATAQATPGVLSQLVTNRIDLPEIVPSARYIKFGFRNNATPTSHTIYEMYPRRLVQSDDIEAENILTLHLGANAVTATKIAALAVTTAKLDAGAVTAAKLTISAGGGNLFLNSGFGLGTTSWTTLFSAGSGTSAIAALTTEQGYNKYALTKTVATGNTSIAQDVTTGWQIGDVLTMTGYVSVSAGTFSVDIIVEHYTAAFGAVVRTDISTAVSVSTTPTRVSYTIPSGIPATTAIIRVRYRFGTLTVGTVAYLAAAKLELGDIATQWNPGFKSTVVIDGQSIMVGTYNAARTILTAGGLYGYNSSNVEQIRIDSTTGTLRAGTAGAQRIEIDSSGLSGYDSGNVLQVRLQSSDGKITAGAGTSVLDANGISIIATTAYNNIRSYRFITSTGVLFGAFQGESDNSTYHHIGLTAFSVAGQISTIGFDASAPSTYGGNINLSASSGAAFASISINADSDAAVTNSVTIAADMTTITGDTVVNGGLSIGTASGAADGEIRYSDNLSAYRNSTYYDGYIFVPLTSRLTSTAWDGDSFSTTAKTLIDLSVVFGAPAGIKAVSIYLAVRDSASATTDTFIILSPVNTANVGPAFSPLVVNDRYNRGALIVPCDANGDIYYQISASGAATFDVVMEIVGYWI